MASSDCLEGIARNKFRLKTFTPRYHVVRVEKNKRATDKFPSPRWLGEGLIVIFKNAQGVTSGCHVEETLVFQRVLKKKIARTNRKKEGKKKYDRRNGAHGPECRYQEKSANAETDDRQEKANRSSQEPLKPDVAKFVSQQNAQGLGGVNQITERTSWVNRDQIAAHHVSRSIGWSGEFVGIEAFPGQRHGSYL